MSDGDNKDNTEQKPKLAFNFKPGGFKFNLPKNNDSISSPPAAGGKKVPATNKMVPASSVEEYDSSDESFDEGQSPLSMNGFQEGLMSALNMQMADMVGLNSGLMDLFPEVMKTRITALKGVQASFDKLEDEYRAEQMALEKKYNALWKPLFERRRDIVNGAVEPTDEEVDAGKKAEKENGGDISEEEEDGDIKIEPVDDEEKPYPDDVKGIPEFWLNALLNNELTASLITEEDEEILRDLVDITYDMVEGKDEDGDPEYGFQVTLHFNDNDFFTNKTLTRVFHLAQDPIVGELVFSHSTGTKIEWKDGKNITVDFREMKVRSTPGKGRRGGRGGGGPAKVVKKQVPVKSFFNWFTPSEEGMELAPIGNIEEEDDIPLRDRVEFEYEVGVIIKDAICKAAVYWYTGELAEEMDMEEMMQQMGGEDGEAPPQCAQQ